MNRVEMEEGIVKALEKKGIRGRALQTRTMREFMALAMANRYLEGQDLKDWAEMLLDGIKPIPKRWTELMEAIWEDLLGEDEAFADDLVTDLKDLNLDEYLKEG